VACICWLDYLIDLHGLSIPFEYAV